MALVGATLIDGTGAPPLSDAVILIEKDRILRVGPRSQVRIPDGADRKDLTGLKILPGLIDSHVHITFALPRGPSDPQADATINGVLQQFLRHGVTSIRDLGAGYPWILDLTRSVEQGRREGPRIFAAGPMLTALGGHPAGTLLRGNDGAIASGTRQIVSPEQGREVVRDLASSGVDVIKAVLDSRGRPNSPERIPALDEAVLGAIVAEAQDAGVPVTVHWGNVNELPAIAAVRPAQLEHAGYAPIPAAVISQIARAGIAVDPTLVIMSATIPSPDQFASGPLENVRRLHEAGVVITGGTDAPLGNLPFGESLHRELELLVKAGLSRMEAIQAATSRPANLVKHADEIRTIQAGKRADLLFQSRGLQQRQQQRGTFSHAIYSSTTSPTKVRCGLAQELFRTRRSHATDRLIARIHCWIEFQLVAIQNCSFSYNSRDISGIANILIGLPVHNKNVSEFARLQSAPFCLGIHNTSRILCGYRDYFQWRQAGLDEQLQFPVNTLTLEVAGIGGIGACGDQDTRLHQSFDIALSIE